MFFADDQILVVGGNGADTNPVDSVSSIDVDENKWKGMPPMPTARYATFSFLIDDKLYVIGKARMNQLYENNMKSELLQLLNLYVFQEPMTKV